MVAEDLTTDESGARGDADSTKGHQAVHRAYRNANRWQTHPKIKVSLAITQFNSLSIIVIV